MSKAGQFRERVTIISPSSPVADGLGGFLPGGETSHEVWAHVKMQAGSEQLRLGLLEAGQPYKVTIRYDDRLTSACRLTWNEVTMQITSIVHDERKTETILYCYATR